MTDLWNVRSARYFPLSTWLKPVKTVSTHSFISPLFLDTNVPTESGIPEFVEKWKHFCSISKGDESRNSLVGTTTAYGLDDCGSIPSRSKILFSTEERPGRLWRPLSLLSNRYRGSFPGGNATGAWSWQDKEWWTYSSIPLYVFMA
jgi:hypothetical protein